ncbi:metal-dependent hydrolase [soil metagenome]
MSAASTAEGQTAGRPVKVRRISFDYPTDELPRHFMAGDLVMSHVVSVLSALFPEGEDFFVRSVRKHRDQIDDPELKAQVTGFIGQEAMHGREHRAFNERLQQLGYPTGLVDRFTGKRMRLNERFLPPHVQLAITAALEHYTATLAEVLLADPDAQAKFGDDEVRSLLLWHAVEESEHKAVAFDVFQAVSGNQRVRATVMNLVTVGFLGTSVGFTILSLLRDPASRDLRRLGRSLRGLRGSPWLTREVRRRIRDYNRPDFHPDDHDATALLDEWRQRLFGAQGTLVDHSPPAEVGGDVGKPQAARPAPWPPIIRTVGAVG